jgi:hypothetical protein
VEVSTATSSAIIRSVTGLECVFTPPPIVRHCPHR